MVREECLEEKNNHGSNLLPVTKVPISPDIGTSGCKSLVMSFFAVIFDAVVYNFPVFKAFLTHQKYKKMTCTDLFTNLLLIVHSSCGEKT